jgi:signal transduction histidine kinase/ligand-binding sensor domain-containing protein/DNA-binding response OmpR family regulator
VQSGLSNNTVYAVEEDQFGFLWVGTENGLNRFDSRDWVHYFFSPADSTGLSNSKIQAILSDHLGRLWIGTAKGLNLFSFETNTFRRIGHDSGSIRLPGDYIRCLFEDSDGELWIGTSEGLSILTRDPALTQGKNNHPVPSKSENPRIRNIRLEKRSGTTENIITIYEDSQGLIWIGTVNGLYFTRNKTDFYPFGMEMQEQGAARNSQIRSLIDLENVLLIATENNGLFGYSREEGWLKQIGISTGSGRNSLIFRFLFMDNDSVLWVASTAGMFRIEKNSWKQTLGRNDAMEGSRVLDHSVRTIFQDRKLGLWIGSQYNGLYSHYADNFLFNRVRYDPIQSDGISNPVVSSFLTEGDSIWIGTDGGGLNLWIREEERYQHWTEQSGLVNNNIKCLRKDAGGNLWIGTFKGLSILQGQAIRNYHLDDRAGEYAGKISDHILAIHLDPAEGTAWLGTDGSGLVKFTPGSGTVTPVSSRFPDFKATSVNVIYPICDSLMVLGTSSGLYSFNSKSGDFFQLEIVLPELGLIEPYVISVERHGDLKFWIATEKYGMILFNLRSNSCFSIPLFREIPGIMIQAIHQTGKSELWCSTNQGLYHITISLSGDSLVSNSSVLYTESYGVQSKQFLPRSSCFSGEGELFFGGIAGFNYFYPSDIKEQAQEIPTHLKSIKYWNSREERLEEKQLIFSSGQRLVFDHYIRDITLEFIGINYSHPENTRYAYRISGEGDSWIELGSRNFITFNHLSNGDYHIEIRSTEEPSNLAGEPAELDITILPPFWKSGNALMVYIISILLLLYLFYRTITRWERLRSKLQVEKIHREQEQQLHEQRIRFFTDISHELRTPLTLILSPIDMIIRNQTLSMRVRNTLQMVKQNGERMLDLINQLLDLRKAETGHLKLRVARGNVVRFLEEEMLSFRDLARGKGIQLQFHSRSKDIEAYYDRNKLEIVITNLLSNALKHTHEKGKVVLSVEEHPDKGDRSLTVFPDGFIQVTIEDNGEGIPADRLDKIFDRFFEENRGIKGMGIGLELSRKYVELHGGSITVESRVEEKDRPGFSRFTIRLPLGRRHLADEQIIDDFIGSEDTKGYIKPDRERLLHADLEAEIEKLPGHEEGKRSRYRLVIVEDNSELKDFLTRMLGDLYMVKGAENGKKGWELILQDPPDLVISDIMMPEMDGIELCRMIKTDIRTSHIPVILLTARTAITFKYEGLETGADEYVTKPFRVEYLSLKIRNLLYQREMTRRKYLRESITDPELITLTSVDEKLLKKTINYIHEHIMQQDLHVESISQHLGMSRVHFYRKIKSITGVTPQEFLRTVKLKYAASLIAQKKLRISEVAYMCGYRDQAYFSKTFKEFYGVTPTDYSSGLAPEAGSL